MMKNNDYKLILIGDSGIGKATLFKKLFSGTFSDKNISTIGMDKRTLNFKDIEVNINGNKQIQDCNIILYDTAGQERYRAITKNYLHGSDIVFMIYDITNRKSFDDIETWFESIYEILSSSKEGNCLIVLLGNKVDLVESEEKPREIEEEEVQKFCEDKGIKWGGELSILNSSTEKLTEMILNCWKEYVQKFGIKDEIPIQVKMEGTKYISKKKKKKGNCSKA